MLAVILAGGYGKRLRPITNTIPKNLIEINGEPIIVHQIRWLKNQGIKRFLLLTGYLSHILEDYLKDGSKYGVSIVYSREHEPLGTGGAVRNAYRYLVNEDIFLLVNGDIITNLSIYPLVEAIRGDESIYGVISVVPLPSPYGIVDFDENGYIRRFREKPLLEDKWINAGVYLFRREILEYLPEKGDIEKTTLPKVAEMGKLKVVKYMGVLWRSIDSFKDIELASKALRDYMEIVSR